MSWIEEAEQKIAEGLVKLANNGSVPAATAALKLLKEQREANTSEVHREKMNELKDRHEDLCEYLGELGQTTGSVSSVLGRPMNKSEQTRHEAGQITRSIEIRALELDSARRGSGKVEPWMRVVR